VIIKHGVATEPGSGNRQLQEKAGGIDPDGLFSLRRATRLRSRPDSTQQIDSDSVQRAVIAQSDAEY